MGYRRHWRVYFIYIDTAVICIPIKLAHDKTYNKTCVTSKDSDRPVYPSSTARVRDYPSLDNLEAIGGTCDQRRL